MGPKSSAVPSLAMGTLAAMPARTSSSVRPSRRMRSRITRSSAPVSISPGRMLLTVTPSGATSRAMEPIAPVSATRSPFDSDMFG
jgi:hypothetical protein